MKRGFFETLQLLIACYFNYILTISFLLFLLLYPHYEIVALNIFLLTIILSYIAIIYYKHYSKERLERFEKMIIKKAKKSLNLSDETEVLKLNKKGKSCNFIMKKMTRADYELSYIFLSDDFLTIATSCPKFHMFYFERHGRDKKWVIKDSCSQNREYRYSYIQSAHYNTSKKSLDIVLTSGFIEHIPSDKPIADKALVKIRERLRTAPRGVQTNILN